MSIQSNPSVNLSNAAPAMASLEGAVLTAPNQITVNVKGHTYDMKLNNPAEAEKLCKSFNESIQKEGSDFQKALDALVDSGGKAFVTFYQGDKNYKIFTPPKDNQEGINWESGSKWEGAAHKTAHVAPTCIDVTKSAPPTSSSADRTPAPANPSVLTPNQQAALKEATAKALAPHLEEQNKWLKDLQKAMKKKDPEPPVQQTKITPEQAESAKQLAAKLVEEHAGNDSDNLMKAIDEMRKKTGFSDDL